jgi:hypothetical protein
MTRSLDEERHSVVRRQRCDRIRLLRGHAEPLARGDDHLRRQLRDCERGVGQQLFDVVEHEQQLARAQVRRQLVGSADDLRDRRLDQRYIGQRGAGDEPDAVRERRRDLGRRLHGQARLAAAAGACQRHDRRPAPDERADLR